MINNEIGRDERVHLNENDIIANESAACDSGVPSIRPWSQTKSDTLIQDAQTQDEKPTKSLWNKVQGAIFPVLVLGVILGLVVMLFIINNAARPPKELPIPYSCSEGCSMSLVESIPVNLTYPAGEITHPSTFSAWKQLITSANTSIHIASCYWSLTNADTDTSSPTASQGEEILGLLKTALKRGVRLYIVTFNISADTDELAKLGAEVKRANFTAIFGSGILHTKFIISDMNKFYVGSANMDWRSLTQVKELGIHSPYCNCPIASDLYKIFQIYWRVADNTTLPPKWPNDLDTPYNLTHPLDVQLEDNETARISFSSSPSELCTTSRDADLDAILKVMDDAREFVHIAVMDYFPTTLYMRPSIYWPYLDDMLKKIAFERKVKVKLLASLTRETYSVMLDYLRSLEAFSSNIETMVFVVPIYGEQADIPYSRINHNKYMVTDRMSYIGTSNWVGDYFIDTGGVGMIFNQSDASNTQLLRQQLADTFLRDWESVYSHNLTDPSIYT